MVDAYFLEAEPAGAIYSEVLALAAERCVTFCLTWRDEISYDPSADELARALKPFIIREERTDRWPGTILMGSLATVRHYHLTPDSLRPLQGPASLYAWRAPQLPEDIAFYTAGRVVWLTTMSREGYAWFDATVQSEEELRRRIPGLAYRGLFGCAMSSKRRA